MVLDYMLPEGLMLVSGTASVVGDMRSPTVCTFWIFVWTVFGRMSFTKTQHISVFLCHLGPCAQNLGT